MAGPASGHVATSAARPAPGTEPHAIRERHIQEIADRLTIRYSGQQTRADLEARIRDTYRQFTTSRVNGYLAILVERLVRRSIDDLAQNGIR